MAAGKFIFFDSWGKYEASGNIHFMISNGIAASLLKASYTPGTSNHSVFTQVSAHIATSSGSIVNAINLTGRKISSSGAGVIKYIANNIDAFSAGGSEILAKYLVLYGAGSASVGGGIERPLMGFFDLETLTTTGVQASQVKITWPSYGIAKKVMNP